MKQVRLACVGRWHVHAEHFLERARKHPHAAVIAVWDEDPVIARQWALDSGCRMAESYYELLRDPDIDGVIITAPTASHAELVACAAAAKKHIYLEKAPAVTNEQAERIYDAVVKSGVHFTLSDPVKKPPLMYAKQLADEGRLGLITSARIRTIHPLGLLGTQLPGFYEHAQAGGGALIDMGCHGVHILNWFLGEPLRAAAFCLPYTQKGREKGIDENSVAIYEFPGGVYGIVETTWISPKFEYEFNLYGTRGTVTADADAVRFCLTDGEWTTVTAEELPPPLEHPLNYWIDSILNDTPNLLHSVNDVIPLTRMIRAAYDSRGEDV